MNDSWRGIELDHPLEWPAPPREEFSVARVDKGFAVRLDRVPALISALRQAGELINAALPAQDTITPPADEPASVDVAEHLGANLTRRHAQVNRAYQDAVAEVVDILGRTMGGYQTHEANATTVLKGRSR